jgi:hypothetical protein
VKTTQVAVVHWLDAYYNEEHLPGDSGCPQISAGILLERTRKHVKLALITDRDNSEGMQEPRDTLTIPRGMVQSIKIVHRERRKNV